MRGISFPEHSFNEWVLVQTFLEVHLSTKAHAHVSD